jgi:hypothetical protein
MFLLYRWVQYQFFCSQANVRLITSGEMLRSAVICYIKQHIVVITCRRFGTTCRSHIEGYISVPSSRLKTPLKMIPIGCPETSVRNDQCTLFNIPGERRFQLLGGRRLESRMEKCFYIYLYGILYFDLAYLTCLKSTETIRRRHHDCL